MSRTPLIFHPDELPTIQHACMRQGIGGESLHSDLSERFRRGIFRMLRLMKGFRRRGQGSAVRTVLIFQHERIGDHILTTPLYAWLRREYPDVRIDVLTSTINQQLVEADPSVRRVFAISPRRGLHAGLWKAVRFLRSDVYDAVFVPTFSARTRNALLIACMRGAPRTATLSDRQRAFRYRGFFDAVRVRDRPSEHVSESVSGIGPELFGGNVELPLPYSPAIAGQTPQRAEPPLIAISIESADRSRSWSWHQAVALSDLLLQHNNEVRIALIHPLRSKEPLPAPNARRTVWSGDLVALSRLLSEASVVVAANSAVVHLAAAAGVPVVGLYNTYESAAEWYPVGVDFRIIMSDQRSAVADIRAEDAFTCLMDLMPGLAR